MRYGIRPSQPEMADLKAHTTSHANDGCNHVNLTDRIALFLQSRIRSTAIAPSPQNPSLFSESPSCQLKNLYCL